jgi:5-methylcytosine-specific restriction protein A
MNKAPTMSQYRPKPKDTRPSAHKRGYGARWRKYRKFYLTSHPLCVECKKMNKITIATVVDHIRPHKGDMKLFWNNSNHQGLCKYHHDSKTAREDGGFGHKMKESSL